MSAGAGAEKSVLSGGEPRPATLTVVDLAQRLRAQGAPYARHVVGNWFEIDSVSDGMCGRVRFENPVTTEYVAYSWSVTSPTCDSEHAAREAARADFERETVQIVRTG